MFICAGEIKTLAMPHAVINNLEYERAAYALGYRHVAGLDEVGRGPLAGPVVAAAVIMPANFHNARVTDSKKLSPKQREELYGQIYAHAVSIGVGIVDAMEIDRINILQASLTAMRLACAKLKPAPDYLLIDGKFTIKSRLAQKAVIKGDSLSFSIACASIVAKVTRDRLMDVYNDYYPEFNFVKHKGYPTKAHKEAILHFGTCPIHRLSFKGVVK